MGSNQRWTAASTITSWPYFHSIKVDYSLNHDIMASFPLNSHPELLKTIHSGFSGVKV